MWAVDKIHNNLGSWLKIKLVENGLLQGPGVGGLQKAKKLGVTEPVIPTPNESHITISVSTDILNSELVRFNLKTHVNEFYESLIVTASMSKFLDHSASNYLYITIWKSVHASRSILYHKHNKYILTYINIKHDKYI